MKKENEYHCNKCNRLLPVSRLISIKITNSYGDKEMNGWICTRCQKKKERQNSVIFFALGIFFIITSALFMLSISDILELQFYNHYYADLPSDYLSYIGLGVLQLGIGISLLIYWYSKYRKQ